MNMILQQLGIQASLPLPQILVSTLGGVISLTVITWISWQVVGSTGAAAVVPSMGAATVLLFVVPHAPLSQPWALFVGNSVSAVIGVLVAQWVPNLALASGLAVGLSIGAMTLTRSTHPPGGATALAAVIGGEHVHALGLYFVFYPVLLNCLVIFAAAIFFNNLFGWRRYPQALMRYKFVTLSPEAISPEEGAVYSNDAPGAKWSVWRVIELAHDPNPDKQLVVFKVLEGEGAGRVDSCSLIEFKRWARVQALPVEK